MNVDYYFDDVLSSIPSELSYNFLFVGLKGSKEELGLSELPGSGIDEFQLVTPGVTPDTKKASFAVLNNFDSIGPYKLDSKEFNIRRVDDDNGDEKYYLVTDSEDLRVHLHENNWDKAIEGDIDRRVFDPEEQIKVTSGQPNKVVSIKIVIGSVAAEAAFVLEIKESLLSESRRIESNFTDEWMERCLAQGRKVRAGNHVVGLENRRVYKFIGKGWESYDWGKKK